MGDRGEMGITEIDVSTPRTGDGDVKERFFAG